MVKLDPWLLVMHMSYSYCQALQQTLVIPQLN
jgi:hypothetical protein